MTDIYDSVTDNGPQMSIYGSKNCHDYGYRFAEKRQGAWYGINNKVAYNGMRVISVLLSIKANISA